MIPQSLIQDLIDKLEKDASPVASLKVGLKNGEEFIACGDDAEYGYSRLKNAVHEGEPWVTITGEGESYITMRVTQISFFKYWE